MNCESIGKVIVDLARSQPVEAAVRAEALAHCAECSNCARRLEAEKALTVGLSALATEMKSLTPSSRTEQNLILALRQPQSVTQTTPGTNRWRYLAIAAAVVCAVTLAIAVLRMRQPQPVETRAEVSPAIQSDERPAAPPTPDSTTRTTPELKKVTQKAVASHRSKKRHGTVVMGTTFVSVVVGEVSDWQQVASPYMAMGYTNAANLQDGAQVVRVELPRYAMARFGLPVNMERYDERVKADVWVGTDGLAQAIRFVQ